MALFDRHVYERQEVTDSNKHECDMYDIRFYNIDVEDGHPIEVYTKTISFMDLKDAMNVFESIEKKEPSSDIVRVVKKHIITTNICETRRTFK